MLEVLGLYIWSLQRLSFISSKILNTLSKPWSFLHTVFLAFNNFIISGCRLIILPRVLIINDFEVFPLFFVSFNIASNFLKIYLSSSFFIFFISLIFSFLFIFFFFINGMIYLIFKKLVLIFCNTSLCF